MRWNLKLAEYEYEIKYKPGKKNKNADALSRNPIDGTKNVYPLRAKRARSSSNLQIFFESSGEHKRLKTSHPSFKRLTRESDGSGYPAPHKKIRADEPSPYIETDSNIEDSPRRKFLRALDESDSVCVTIQPNHIITKVITILTIQKNIENEKKGNMKVIRQITSNEEDKGDGRNEKS